MRTQRHELTAWLGPAADEMNPEQIDDFARVVDDIDARYPDPDDQDLRDAAMSAEVQMILGETTPEDAKRRLISARREALRASVAAQQIAVRLVRSGTEKKAAAEATGISRPTLDKALGE